VSETTDLDQRRRPAQVEHRGVSRRAVLGLLLIGMLTVVGCSRSAPAAPSNTLLDEVRAKVVPDAGVATSYGLALSLDNTQRFIDFYTSVSLTTEQEETKRLALTALSAPCCDDNTMYEC
jgi:hypothetical protein